MYETSDIIKTIRLSGKILDCGTGDGEIIKFNSNIFGLDREDLRKEEFKKFYKDFKLIDFNTDKIPYNDNSFDVVTAFELIEHLENPHHFIREVHRVLAPNGIFHLSTPNVYNLFNRYYFFRTGDMPRWKAKNDHRFVMPKGIFEKTVLKYFKIQETKYIGSWFPYRFLKDFKFPENRLFGKTIYWVLKNELYKKN